MAVGHIIVLLILIVETTSRISPNSGSSRDLAAAHARLDTGAAAAGRGSAVVGLQWALGMHGFDPDHRDLDEAKAPPQPDIG